MSLHQMYDDDEYYEAVVSEMEGGNVYLEYDDGDTEWLDLADETFRFVNETQNQDEDDVSSNEASKSSDEEYDETSPYEDDYCAEDNEPLFEEVGTLLHLQHIYFFQQYKYTFKKSMCCLLFDFLVFHVPSIATFIILDHNSAP